VGLRLHKRALVTGGHVCAVGARQWMVGWNVAMVVGSHIHFSWLEGIIDVLRSRCRPWMSVVEK
jgi:hypothetical protein